MDGIYSSLIEILRNVYKIMKYSTLCIINKSPIPYELKLLSCYYKVNLPHAHLKKKTQTKMLQYAQSSYAKNLI